MTALSLIKILFHISGQYRAEVTDTAVCTPDTAVQLTSLCCPVLFQARPIDSLNRTSIIRSADAHTYNIYCTALMQNRSCFTHK